MSLVVTHIRWIMIASGLLTCWMVRTVLWPQEVMQATFGTTLDGPLAEIIVRSWGMMITVGGVALIAAASRPAWRPVVLAMTGAGKLVFVLLVFIYGRDMLDHQVRIAVVADTIMVILFAACLLSGRRAAA